jgi:hypothetical protein
MAGGGGFQPRFTRAIAVKNRSHNYSTFDVGRSMFDVHQFLF